MCFWDNVHIYDFTTDLKLEQRANIKFCVKFGKMATEVHEMFQQAYEQ